MKFKATEQGQGAVEFLLIAALIAAAVIVVLTILDTQISRIFSQISSVLG